MNYLKQQGPVKFNITVRSVFFYKANNSFKFIGYVKYNKKLEKKLTTYHLNPRGIKRILADETCAGKLAPRRTLHFI